jgi:hypothetical protein
MKRHTITLEDCGLKKYRYVERMGDSIVKTSETVEFDSFDAASMYALSVALSYGADTVYLR